MERIALIGLGTMGLPMARNLVARGVAVLGADLSAQARGALEAAGGQAVAPDALDLAGCAAVITMLPEGRHVAETHARARGAADPGTLFVDCSTIDVETTRALAAEAEAAGHAMLDAPVSGGPEAAGKGALSFMVGGAEDALERARPLLEQMGARISHFGPAGSGQAAKACHNMICGITAMAVCEGFALAEALGLAPDRFYALCKGAAAQSWTLENRCPVPGVVPATPASNGYAPGFAAGLMAKDLRLAQAAAQASGQATPFGAEAARAFTDFAEGGGARLDFSAFYRTLRPED